MCMCVKVVHYYVCAWYYIHTQYHAHTYMHYTHAHYKHYNHAHTRVHEKLRMPEHGSARTALFFVISLAFWVLQIVVIDHLLHSILSTLPSHIHCIDAERVALLWNDNLDIY